MTKPSYKRAERVADQIRMEVADILARKTKDPRVGFMTVTGVDLSPDLRVAKVFVTTLQEGQEEETGWLSSAKLVQVLHCLMSALYFPGSG